MTMDQAQSLGGPHFQQVYSYWLTFFSNLHVTSFQKTGDPLQKFPINANRLKLFK